MSAICAGCQRPIVSGQPFVLSGTEVFHRTAACQTRIATSVLTRAKHEIIKLRDEALRERQAAATARIDAQSAEDRVRRLEHDLLVEREHHTNTRRRWNALDHAATTLQHDVNSLTAQRADLRNELATARAEISRLQAEALRRATADLPAPESADQRDATEIRFSLLELDKE